MSSVSEANTAAKQIKVRATLDGGSVSTNTLVNLSVGGTATRNTDYTATFPTSVLVSANNTSATSGLFNITTTDDSIVEGTETIVVSGTATGFSVKSATVNLNDNDDAPNQVVLSFTPVSEGAGATTSTVTATLANSDSSKPQDVVLTQDVTVTLALGTGGTATSGTDYTALQSPLPTVTISAGQLSGTATISITPTADTVDDDGETIPFTASATTTQSGVTLTGVGANMVITEDVALITSLAGANNAGLSNAFLAQPFTAGSAGSGPAVVSEVKIEFSNARSAVSVKIREDNGSNRPDMSADGLVATLTTTQSLSGTGVIAFTPMTGETIVLDGGSTYFVMIHEGSTVTPNSRKSVRLTNTAATGQTGWAMGTRLSRTSEGSGWGTPTSRVKMEVRGNVLPTPTVSFSSATYSATEGSTATVTVNLSEAPKREVVIPISATNQNNASASDYSGIPESLTFGADDTTKSFTFTAADDSLDDNGESVDLAFGTLPSGVTAGTTSTATVSITDNDDTPDTINLSFDPASVDEDATGNVAVKVVATLAGTSTRTVATTVNLDSTLGGTADRGTGTTDDYTSSGLPSSVTIAAGQSKGEATGLTINPTDNSTSDGARTITLGGTVSGFTVNDATMNLIDEELPKITLTVVDNSDDSTVTSVSEAVTTAKTVKIKATADAAVAANTEITLTLGGTASGSGTDYNTTGTVPTTVTISSGATSGETGTFTIATVDDSLSEGDETITFSGSVTGFNVQTATVTLADNDQPVITLSLSPASASEAAGNQTVSVSATRSSSSTAALTVTVSPQSSSTAVRNTDWSGSSSVSISFPANNANSNSATFNIDPTEDRLVEGDETIVLGATVANHTVTPATFTIDDNDTASTSISLSLSTTSLAESAGSTAVTVTATVNDGAVVGDTVVGLTLGGTATSGTDYTRTPATLPSITISAGTRSGSATINFDPTEDTLDEGTGETIVITGSKTSGDTSITTVGSATVTISDNDATPDTVNLSFDPASIAEDAGSTAVKVVATLAGNSTRTVDTVVQLGSLTDDGNGPSYTSSGLPTSVTISAGQSKGEATGLSIVPADDSNDDGDRVITLAQHATNTLSGFTVNDATLTIADDEVPKVTLTLSPTSADESAGNQQVMVSATRSASSKAQLDVTVTRHSTSTAVRGSDYSGSTSATITFPANNINSNSATFNINPTQDLLAEGNETIVLSATVAGHTVVPATFTITDDDDAPDRVFVTFASVGEGAGATTSTVTARLGNSDSNKDQNIALPHNVVVRLAETINGSATSGTDYGALGATLPTVTISAGQNSGTVNLSITPTQDTLDEGTGETIQFSATANCRTTADPCPAAQQVTGLTVPAATLTITDDDTTPTVINLSFDPASIAEDAAGDGSGDVAVKVVATLAGNSTRTVDTTVQLATTLGGTATSSHYASSGLPTSVTISAGESSGEVTGFKVNPTDNSMSDGTRTITLAQGTPALSGFTVNQAALGIVDDEKAPITLSLTRLQPSGDPADSMNEGQANSRFRVTATRTTGTGFDNDPVSVTLAVQATSTATEGDISTAGCSNDYEAASGHLTRTISLARNAASANTIIQLSACQDRIIETGGETIVIGGTPSRATVFDVVPVTLTINDDDNDSTAITLTLSPTSLNENAAATSVTVTAEVDDGAPTAAVTITLDIDATSTATRGSGGDYTAPAALGDANVDITIAAGEVSGTASFSIDPIDDNLDEGTGETIVIDAAGGNSAGGLAVPVSSATLTIDDDDVSVQFSEANYTVTEAAGATRTATITVELNEASGRSLTIPITHTGQNGATQPGQAGADYSVSATSVTIPAGQTSRTFTINAVDDTVDDDGESILLGFGTLPTGAEAGTISASTVSITDDDDPEITVEFDFGEYTASEAAGGRTATVTVNLSAPAERDVSIPITHTPMDGATAGDYSGVPTSVAFGAFETTKTFTLTVVDDTVDDDDETVEFGFGSTLPNRVTVGTTDTATVRITDDDDPFVTVNFSRATYTAREGDTDGTTVTVTLSADPERTVTIPITHTPMDGATAGDYTLSATSVTFNAGETSKTFTITATDDAANDDGESVELGFGVITDPQNRVNLGTLTTASVPITDNNAPHVTEVEVLGRPADGQTYRAGEFITLRVTFSEGIRVTRRGNVYLSLHSADGWFGARALRGWNSGVLRLWGGYADVGEEFDTMEFRYRVSQGDQAADQLVVGTHSINGGGLVLADGLELTGTSGELIDPAIDPMGFGFKVDGGDAPRNGRTDGTGGLQNASGPCRRDISLGRWHGRAQLRNAWGVGCESRANPGTYAAYFTFTLGSPTQVRLHAQGGAPAQATIRLREGRTYTGDVIATASASGYSRARFDGLLAAGTYTLEVAPTRHNAAVPDVSGLGFTLWAGTVAPPPTAISDCVANISRGQSAAARWVAGCNSVTNTGRSAAYYVFTGDGAWAEFTVTSPDATEEAYLWEWDSDNRGSAQVDAATSGSASCHNRCATVRHRTIAGRTYSLEVTGDDASANGRYLVSAGSGGSTPPAECITNLGRMDYTNAELRQMGRSRPNGWQFGHMVGRRAFGWPCFSGDAPATYARYFTFELAEDRDVRMEIYGSNAAGVTMVLRRGTATSGGPAAGSHHPGQPVQSRLDQRLQPGTYTVEVRAASTGRTSHFELIIKQGPPQWVPDAQCIEELPLVLDGGGIWHSGQWAEPCWSNARSGRHARWYTFTVTPAQAARGFNLNMSLLSSDADPYLILRQGESYTGWSIAEVDDSWHWGSWLSAFDAQIIRNGLPAGTYTIEAATDRNGLRGDAGAFSLAASIRTPLEAPDAPTGLSATASTTEFDEITASWTLPPAPPNKPRSAVVVQWWATSELQTLVSNTGQGNGLASPQNLSSRSSQGFTTGSNSAGYTLASVDVEFTAVSTSPNVSVAILNADSSGEPGSVVATLTNPASLAVGTNKFTASGQGVSLTASTTYFVRVSSSTSDTGTSLRYTTLSNEDSGAAAGWSIANDNWYGLTNSSDLLKMALHGSAKGATPSGPPDGSAVLGAGATTHTISGLAHSTVYTITAKARNSEGDSGTASATATTLIISPPAAPSGVSATTDANVPGTITVTWTNGASTAAAPRTAVVVSWNTADDPTNTLRSAVLAADATSYTITGLAHSTAYSVAVKSRNPAGDSADARQASDVVTPANPLGVWFGSNSPKITMSTNDNYVRVFMDSYTSRPAAVTCWIASARSINCPPGTLISIGQRFTGTQTNEPVHELVDSTANYVGTTIVSHTITGVNYDQGLVIRARACGADCTSDVAWTEWNFYTDVGGPEAPTIAVSAGNQKITVGWTPPGLGTNGEYGKPGNVLSGYQVWHRAQNSDGTWPGWTESAWLGADVREHEITGLTNDVKVQVRVRARAQSGGVHYKGMTTGSCPANQREMCNGTPTSGAGSPSAPQNLTVGAPTAAGEVLGPGESPEGAGIRVAAGEGELVILEIQPPGKKKMDGGAFARGYPCKPGLMLGEGA